MTVRKQRTRALVPVLRDGIHSEALQEVDVLGPTKGLRVRTDVGVRAFRLVRVRVVGTGEELWLAQERIRAVARRGAGGAVA